MIQASYIKYIASVLNATKILQEKYGLKWNLHNQKQLHSPNFIVLMHTVRQCDDKKKAFFLCQTNKRKHYSSLLCVNDGIMNIYNVQKYWKLHICIIMLTCSCKVK